MWNKLILIWNDWNASKYLHILNFLFNMGARQSYNVSKRSEAIKDSPSPFDSLPAHLLTDIFSQIVDVRAKVCRRFGARQSYNVSKHFDGVMKDVPCPFDSLPGHLLVKIFSQITDERVKIRLERVCRRFRRCIQLDWSWRFNTQLDTQRLKSPDSLLAFLKRVPLIRGLNLDSVQEDLGWLRPQVLEHARKFKLSHLHARGDRTDTVEFLKHCVQYSAPSLTHLDLSQLEGEIGVDILDNFVAKCNALQKVQLSRVSASPQAVFQSLTNKPLRILKINVSERLYKDTIDPRWMTEMINSVPNHTLHTFEAWYWMSGATDFCRQLETSAARGLKKICLSVEIEEDGRMFEFVRRVPYMLPNVEDVMIISVNVNGVPFSCLGCMQALKYLLDSNERRDLWLRLVCLDFTRSVFDDTFAVVFGSSNEYMTQDDLREYTRMNTIRKPL